MLIQPFPKQQIIDTPKLKKFEDNNFKFGDNDRKFSKRVENTVGKGEIACSEQFLLFPLFLLEDLYHRYVKTRACGERFNPLPLELLTNPWKEIFW